MPGMDFFVSEPLLAMVRFGKFDDILDTPRPDPKYPTLTALWLHAHGIALAATGDLDGAAANLAELRGIPGRIAPGSSTVTNDVRDVVDVGARVLAALLAHERGDPRELALWDGAVAAEDRLSYAEPSDWFYPVRHYQGAALLDRGRWSDAEAVYRADLAKHPHNGWALWGLGRALRGQHRDGEAVAVEREFRRAWANADIELTNTAFW
jgi:tetratricopeptide (TPR) repeat protein